MYLENNNRTSFLLTLTATQINPKQVNTIKLWLTVTDDEKDDCILCFGAFKLNLDN